MDFMDFMDSGGRIDFNLTNTAELEAWNDEYSGSFTRTGDINVFDFEVILQTGIPTDTAAFYGGREVTNLCLQSQDISNAVWLTPIGGSKTGTDGFQALGQYDYMAQIITTVDSSEYTISFLASVEEGGQSSYWIYHSPSETSSNTEITLTTTPKRYSATVLGKVGGGNIDWGIQDRNASNWAKVTITDFQVEEVTGQAVTAPSDHIPTIATAITKFYDTENGNTVSSNIVTEATGDDIESVIGMAFWPSTTNVIGSAQYRDFTHADWNKVNGSITAGDVVLIDGTTVADKNTFTASAANATIILDPYVSASGTHSGGVFCKRKTGSGDIEVTIDGGTTWVAVTITQADWTLIQTTLTVTDPEFGVRVVASGDAVYLDWAQMDDGEKYVSDICPIAGGETLGTQNFNFDRSKLVTNKQGAVIVEHMVRPIDDPAGTRYILSDTGTYIMYSGTTNNVRSYDSSNSIILNGALDGYTKSASYWWDSNKQISSNALSSSVGIYDGTWGTGNLRLGYTYRGILSKLSFYYNTKVTQAEMEEETT